MYVEYFALRFHFQYHSCNALFYSNFVSRRVDIK